MPAGSTIVIKVNNVDVTDRVLFARSSFESQMAAINGQFSITLKDPLQTFSANTGQEVSLEVDGVKVFGGYALQITKTYAFPADDTTDGVANVKSRLWTLTGPDYNFLFDKRVLRRTTDYKKQIPRIRATIADGEIIRTYFPTYFDIPSGFDFTDVSTVIDNYTYTYNSTTKKGGFEWDTQGTKMRDVLERLAQYGSVFYMDADRKLNYLPVQDTAAPWGFSDTPNGTTTIGFREGEMTEDATGIVNDALVWGGSEWAGNGDIVFQRKQNAASQALHGRWQLAEDRVGDKDYSIQRQVTERARVIVDGTHSGTSYVAGSQGMVNPEIQFRGTWFGHDVPSGVHLIPGQVVPITLAVFGPDPIEIPLRRVRITFPTLDSSVAPSKAFVRFEGFFGVMMSDPYWLWAYLRKKPPTMPKITTANNTTVAPIRGSHYQDQPTQLSSLLYEIPFPYISRTLRVNIAGLQKIRGVDYYESDPSTGQFTLAATPGGTILVDAILRGS